MSNQADEDVLELARAFASARYRVQFAEALEEFGVGDRVPQVEARLPASAYAFITAWNPDAKSRPTPDNAESDDAFSAHLDALGLPHVRTWGQAPDGGHREAGWLIAGLDVARADALARETQQAGILAWLAGEPVRLRVYRACPAGGERLAHVDWIE